MRSIDTVRDGKVTINSAYMDTVEIEVEAGIRYDINSEEYYQIDRCGGLYTVLTDLDDWAHIQLAGLQDTDGARPVVEIISCGPGRRPGSKRRIDSPPATPAAG